MNYATKVARIAGIQISVHWTFGLLIAWVLYSGLERGFPHAIGEVTLLLLLFGCVLLHELGHAAAARYFGIPTHGITMLPIGGVAQLDRIPRNPKQELIIALAGPAVNVFLVGLMVPLSVVLSDLGTWAKFAVGSSMLSRLLWMNVALFVFNLVPAFPMDGGRVLRALLATRIDYGKATQWAKRIGQMIAVGFVLLGAAYNPMLILVAMFIAFAAEVEYRTVLAEQSASALAPNSGALGSVAPRNVPSPQTSSAMFWLNRLPGGVLVIHRLRPTSRDRWGWE